MLKSKQFLTSTPDDDLQDYIRAGRISKTLQYKNSESIQEVEEDHSSSQIHMCSFQPASRQAFLQQPIDHKLNEDIRAPTLTHFTSEKAGEQLDSKNTFVRPLISQSQSHSSFFSYLRRGKSSKAVNKEKKKNIFIEIIKQKFLNSIQYSKYNDPIITQEQKEISSNRYHYFSLYIFYSTIISNLLTVTIIPLVSAFEASAQTTLLQNIIFGVKLLGILQDLYCQRGPYKMIRGKIIDNFRNTQKIYFDLIRLGLIIVNAFITFQNFMTIVFLLLFLLCEIARQCESFENIYSSTWHFVIILQLWVTMFISFTYLLRIFNENNDISLVYCLTLSISIITHSATASFEINESSSIIVSIYIILSYFCILYTSIIIFIWIKPALEMLFEKEKLLKGFIQFFSQKCQNQELLRRCYSYLEFRLDQDLGRVNDQLIKKLSFAFRQEIDMSLGKIMINKIGIMNKFSHTLKFQLLNIIEYLVFNPDENIIVENQIEDIGLYYILKGEVKVQIYGTAQGHSKKSITRLYEGQIFGQHAFISGVPSNIGIFSCGVTTIMKIKRSDFLETISYYPEDNEIFCAMKDNLLYNQSLFECSYCKITGDNMRECQHIEYFPKRVQVVEKHLFSMKQQRRPFFRQGKKYLTLKNLTQNQESAKKIFTQIQDINSDELPEASQLPYSENQIYTISDISNSGPYQKQCQEKQVSSNVNAESLEHLTSEQEHLDVNLIVPQISLSKDKKASQLVSHRTAGFSSSIGREDKQLSEQLSEGQKHQKQISPNLQHPFRVSSNRNMLSFQLTPDEVVFGDTNLKISQHQHSNENSKGSSRQLASFRSATYTHSISKDVSYNQSSNSRQNILPFQTKEVGKKYSSSNTQSDKNKVSDLQKTETKFSNSNQISYFQALPTPDNSGSPENDLVYTQFEKMKKFKVYNPQNNFDKVIQRCKAFMNKKRKSNANREKVFSTPYSIKCYVASKITKIKKLLKI